jgi:thiol-disulfide isomerase/thioredoxin
MKNSILITGLVLLIAGCSRNNNSYGTLQGSISNLDKDTTFCLIDYDSDSIIQKFVVRNGRFKIKYSTSGPTQFTLRPIGYKYTKDWLNLWLDNSPTKLYGNMLNMANSKIEGSAPNEIYSTHNTIELDFEHDMTKISLKKYTKDQKILDSLTMETSKLQADYKTKLMKFYTEYINSEVALYYLESELTKYNTVLTKSDLKHCYDLLPEKLRISKYGTMIKDYASLPEVPKIGDKFIDFAQLTPDDRLESISSNLGKYTILEFWASFCGNCRVEHPRLRKLFEKYHTKGLNIIGISGDYKLSDWLEAIKKDSIPWLNISDLQGYQNKGFLLYGAKAIPVLILIDENGIILDDNFRAKYIEGELKKLFE